MSISYKNYGNNKASSKKEEKTGKDRNKNLFEDYPVESEDIPGAIDQSTVDSYDTHKSKMEEAEAEQDDEDINDVLSELKQLVGLKRVKYEIRRLMHYVRVQELRRTRGITSSHMALHSVFYGNPGTGKTTVARLYGRMLNALGLLSQGHLVETDRSGLVANYIGQTATKTDSKVKEALGGVLFIDEAYSLWKGEDNYKDFGGEALEIIVKRMEDHRDNLVVIVAGYPKPMKRFINSNEGLKSRFSTFIHFDDYSPAELLEIFRLFCEKENYEIGEEALELTLAAIEYEYRNRDDTFGNARFTRNLFETVIRNHAIRVGMTKEDPSITDLKTILPEDVPLITDNGDFNTLE